MAISVPANVNPRGVSMWGKVSGEAPGQPTHLAHPTMDPNPAPIRTPARWWTLARLALGLVAATIATGGLAACSNPSDDDAGPAATPAPAVADDDIVWQELTFGGSIGPEAAASEVPAVQILGDGRVFVTEPTEPSASARAAVVRSGTVEPDVLADFLADAEASGLFEPGVDFGDPGTTDLATTSVNLFRGDIPLIVSVGGLDLDADGPGSLDAAQVDRREQLRALMAQARELADDLQPVVPEAVRVTLLPEAPATSPPPTADGAPAWPGPPIEEIESHVGHTHDGEETDDAHEGEGHEDESHEDDGEEHADEPPADGALPCLPVEGDEAAALDEAAAANPTSWWRLDDGSLRQLIVAPILPGDEPCPAD